MNVSHTCRDWRDVTLSSGILWSRLHISYWGGKSIIKEALDTWLQRSHDSPLCYSVTVMFRDECERLSHLVAEGIVASMLAHQIRWKDVSLYLYKVVMSPAIQEINVLELPALTSLNWTFTQFEEPQVRACINISSSKELGRLHLCGTFELEVGTTPIQTSTDTVDVTFRKTFTHFKDTEMCLKLLQVAPNLRRFNAEFNDRKWESLEASVKGPMLTLPQLRIIYLEAHDFGFPILDRLTLPGLELMGYGVHEAELISALQYLPALQELRTFSHDFSEAFVRALTIEGDLDVDVDIGRRDGVYLRAFLLTGLSNCDLDEKLVLESHGIQGYIEEGLKVNFDGDDIVYFPFNEDGEKDIDEDGKEDNEDGEDGSEEDYEKDSEGDSKEDGKDDKRG
ncbi:hypothetical protein M0805_003811 [Coniferiporia weirii]|nr:hypothetical protein M0805_003811 [Coniferiporia weirii]